MTEAHKCLTDHKLSNSHKCQVSRKSNIFYVKSQVPNSVMQKSAKFQDGDISALYTVGLDILSDL